MYECTHVRMYLSRCISMDMRMNVRSLCVYTYICMYESVYAFMYHEDIYMYV